MDTSSRTSVALVRVLCARLFRIRAGHRGTAARSRARCSTAAMPRSSSATTRCCGITPGCGRSGDAAGGSGSDREDRSGCGVDVDDRAAVRLGVLGRARRRARRRRRAGAARCARDEGVAQSDAVARDYFRDAPQHHDIGVRYLRDNIKYYSRRARNARASSCSIATRWKLGVMRRPTRGRLLVLLEMVTRTDCDEGSRRRPDRWPPRRSSCIATPRRRCSAASPTGSARASIPIGSSPTSSIATSTTPTSASRSATSARSIATVGSPEGYVLGFDELFRKIDETDRRRRRPVAAAGRSQSRPAADLVRRSVPRDQGRAIPTSSCTRCRRRKSSICRGCRSCRCRRSSSG